MNGSERPCVVTSGNKNMGTTSTIMCQKTGIGMRMSNHVWSPLETGTRNESEQACVIAIEKQEQERNMK